MPTRNKLSPERIRNNPLYKKLERPASDSILFERRCYLFSTYVHKYLILPADFQRDYGKLRILLWKFRPVDFFYIYKHLRHLEFGERRPGWIDKVTGERPPPPRYRKVPTPTRRTE